eukprot:evm.model.scf_833.2 EVM.evm.TU.scf_833.2   scf_833:13272-20229(+)
MVTTVITAERLLQDACSGPYAVRQNVDLLTLKTLWSALSHYGQAMLRTRKGVLFPSLGTFYAGAADAEGRRLRGNSRPWFELLEGRFVGVSQELGKATGAGRGSVAHPNYHVIARDANLHRSACQRLTRELLQQLALHVVSGQTLNVAFPGLGVLKTNRAGRLEFKFDSMLLELMKMPTASQADSRAQTSCSGKRSNGATPQHQCSQGEVAQDPQEASTSAACSPEYHPRVHWTPAENPVADGERPLSSPCSPGAALHYLWKLCRATDRSCSGCVSKAQMERWLQREARQLAQSLDAATVLDLLQVHAYGKTGKFLLYRTFLEAIKTSAVETAAPRQADILKISHTSQPASPEPQADRQEAGSPEGIHPAGQDLREQEPNGMAHDASAKHSGEDQPASRNVSQATSHEPYFLQKQCQVRSRGECDDFNRYHFGRLSSSRGGLQQLAPKVGEEPLTVEEANLVKTVSPAESPRGSPRVKSEEAVERCQRGAGLRPTPPEVGELLGEQHDDALRRAHEKLVRKRRETRDMLRQSWDEQVWG